MTRLKLTAVQDENPIKMTIEIPASTYQDLIQYGEILAGQTGRADFDTKKLAVKMIEKFLMTDRAFAKLKKIAKSKNSF